MSSRLYTPPHPRSQCCRRHVLHGVRSIWYPKSIHVRWIPNIELEGAGGRQVARRACETEGTFFSHDLESEGPIRSHKIPRRALQQALQRGLSAGFSQQPHFDFDFMNTPPRQTRSPPVKTQALPRRALRRALQRGLSAGFFQQPHFDFDFMDTPPRQTRSQQQRAIILFELKLKLLRHRRVGR